MGDSLSHLDDLLIYIYIYIYIKRRTEILLPLIGLRIKENAHRQNAIKKDRYEQSKTTISPKKTS